MALPKTCVKRPVTVLMVFCAIILVGIISLYRLPVELMPNFSFGDISIFVDIRGGMPPVEVENLVTKPIEESVGTVSHLENLISISEEGRSRVVMSFEPGINMDFAALEVREKFARVKDKLPEQIEKPVIAKFEQSDVPVLILAVTGADYTPEMLRKIVDEQIKERIQRITGVANVEVGGGRERKILVEVDQKKLQAFRLPIGRVINALNLNNLNLLAGDIEKQKQKYLIRTLGSFKSIEDIKNIGIAVAPSGTVIKVKDVASVKDSFLEAYSYARVNVLPVVSLYIQKESTANTMEVIDGILKEVEKMKPSLDKKIKLIPTYNQADTIKKAIDGVKQTLLIGAFLAIIVLWLFLRDIRSTFIIALSIPISVIATFALMYFQKITLNVMTLIGLALGTGMLVDNSIVVLENIFSLKQKGIASQDKFKVSVLGAEEMVLAIVASTVTTVVVFLPIVFVSKEIRLLYSGLAFTVTYSLLASLFVALTLVPSLAAHLPGSRLKIKDKKQLFKKEFLRRLKEIYKRVLVLGLRFRYVFITFGFILFVIAVVLLGRVEKEFIGTTEQEDFTIFVELPTGAKLDISDQAISQIEKVLSANPEVKTFSSRIEKWSSKIYVKLLPIAERRHSTKEIIENLRPKMEEIERQYREAFIYFEEPQEVETNEVILEIYGYDYDILNELAISMLTRMQTIEGLTDLKIRWRRGRPEWRFKIDKQKAAMFGLTVEDVANILHAQMRGLRATLYHTEAKEIEVIARLQEKDRRTLDDLRKLTITLPDRTQIYLEQLAVFQPGLGPSKIWRKNKSRMIQVSANRGRYAFGTAAKKIKEVLSDMKLPKDYYWRFGENYFRMLRNQKEMSFALMLSLILIYLVLASLFESYSQPFIILVTVPLAVVGVVGALLLTKKSINIGVLMGAIMLGGIVVNNAIILIDHINSLRRKEINRYKALITAGSDRLRPIMMTTGTTILGLVPMAFDRSEMANLWSPLAVTVIGGLTTSTILTLVIVPSMYLVFEDIKRLIQPKKAISLASDIV